ncbi:MAG TPA: cytochrome c oxidase subunit 4 [Acidimicrobiales bacterium]|nr:cytochrome c oxidase subunit 4 [Acidimicrobiales bacterium]
MSSEGKAAKQNSRPLFMKSEAYIFAVIGIFFAIICVVYYFWNRTTPAGKLDVSGTVMLFLAGCLGLLPGGYMFYWSRRAHPRTEDRDAELAEGAGVVDVFPGSSIWPAVTGAGASLLCVGLVFGLWLTLMGGFLLVSAFIGFIAESRRGGTY